MTHPPYDWESRPATTHGLDEDEVDAFRVLMDAVAAMDGATMLAQTNWIREHESPRATALTSDLTHQVRRLGTALADIILGNRATVAELDQLRDAAARTTASLQAALPDDPPADDPQLEAKIAKVPRRSRTKEQRGLLRAARRRRLPLMQICPEHVRLERAAAVLRAAALEAHDIDLKVSSETAAFTATWTELTTEAADAELADLLLYEVERYDANVASHLFERDAADWWFRCHTSRWRFDIDVPKRASMDWVLIDRTMLLLGDTPLAAFARTPAFHALGPRMQRLHAALEQSHVGLFLVQPSWGDTALLEELSGTDIAREYSVSRRSQQDGLDPGRLAVGRLIPNGDGHYLRAQAMVTVDPFTTGKDADHWRRRFDMLCAAVPRALAAEAVLSEMLKSKERLPRRGAAYWIPDQTRWDNEEIETLLDTKLPVPPPGHPNAKTLRRAGRVVADPSIRAFREGLANERKYGWGFSPFVRTGRAVLTDEEREKLRDVVGRTWLSTLELMLVSCLLCGFGAALAGVASQAEWTMGSSFVAATLAVVGALVYTWARTGQEMEDYDVPPGPAMRRGLLVGVATAIGLGVQTWLSDPPSPGDTSRLDTGSAAFALTLLLTVVLATTIVSWYARTTWPDDRRWLREDDEPWPPAPEVPQPVRWLGGRWSMTQQTGIALRAGLITSGSTILGLGLISIPRVPLVTMGLIAAGVVAICARAWGDAGRALAVLESSDDETAWIGASLGLAIGLCAAVTPLVCDLAGADWIPEVLQFHPFTFIATLVIPTAVGAVSLVIDTWGAASRSRRFASQDDL